MIWKRELTEVEQLKRENADLKKQLERSKRDAWYLRWTLIPEWEKEVIRLCYRMLAKEAPTYEEREKFKQDFIDFRGKAMFRKDYTKEADHIGWDLPF